MRTRNSSKSSKNEKSIKRKNLKRKRSITTDKPLKKGKSKHYFLFRKFYKVGRNFNFKKNKTK